MIVISYAEQGIKRTADWNKIRIYLKLMKEIEWNAILFFAIVVIFIASVLVVVVASPGE